METKQDRAAAKIAALALEARDLVVFWRAVSDVVAQVVPHYWGPCWYTLDPATLLITSHFHEGMLEFPPEWLTSEYYGGDVLRIAEVATSTAGISTLHEATNGQPETSPRWRQNMEMGGDQEMILALRTAQGETWGALGLYREPGKPLFTEEELRWLSRIAPTLANGVRRALVFGEAADPDGPLSPAVLLLDARLGLETRSPGADGWLALLPGPGLESGRLPSAVLSVAAAALDASDGDFIEAATVRVSGNDGRWIAVHGSTLGVGEGRKVAVVIEAADRARIFPLLASAYQLTPREQDVTTRVLRGSSTAEIADDLLISALTVQEHLKHIFEKTGVRSRRDLAGKLFFAHYEPRLRDNERRAQAANPSVVARRAAPWRTARLRNPVRTG